MSASEFDPESVERATFTELASVTIPCAVCVVHAVREGVDYGNEPPGNIVGQTYGVNGDKEIHEAVAQVSGTDVCWYHADDAAKAAGL